MRGKVQLSLLQLQPQESVGDAAAWASTPGSARHLLFQQGPWQQGPSISSRGAGSVNFYVSYSELAQIFFLTYLILAALFFVALRAFLSCGEQGCASLWCTGFCLQRLLFLGSTGFRVLGLQ